MITYDSHKWWSLVRIRGSVLPRGAVYSILPAVLSCVLKAGHDEGWFDIYKHSLIEESAAFSTFGWTLSFLLVFRTGHCYTRFWSCATGTCTVRAQLFQACASLVSFSQMSKKPKEEIWAFRNEIVRLTSLVHALMLSVLADLKKEEFAVIDVASIPRKFVDELKDERGRAKVHLVYIWTNNLIVRAADSGLLNVPPPILSRVFQELEKASVEYSQVLQIMTIPFPFPFAQFSVVGLLAYFCMSPFVMTKYASNAAGAFLFTFLSCCCLVCLELIASELENPFGTDANDLPCHTFQEDLNSNLILLLEPAANEKFFLQGSCDFQSLKDRSSWHSFKECGVDIGDSSRNRTDELGRQMSGDEYDKLVKDARTQNTIQTISPQQVVLENGSGYESKGTLSQLKGGSETGEALAPTLAKKPNPETTTPAKPICEDPKSNGFEPRLMGMLNQIHERLRGIEYGSKVMQSEPTGLSVISYLEPYTERDHLCAV